MFLMGGQFLSQALSIVKKKLTAPRGANFKLWDARVAFQSRESALAKLPPSLEGRSARLLGAGLILLGR